jgi:hypothetical protein
MPHAALFWRNTKEGVRQLRMWTGTHGPCRPHHVEMFPAFRWSKSTVKTEWRAARFFLPKSTSKQNFRMSSMKIKKISKTFAKGLGFPVNMLSQEVFSVI